MNINQREVIEFFHQQAAHFERDMESFVTAGDQIARRTTQIIRYSMLLLCIAGVFIVWLLWQMTGQLESVVVMMNEMYTNFGEMSKDMQRMTSAVVAMDQHMAGMPGLGGDMQAMNTHVASMASDVGSMNQDLQQLDAHMTQIDTNVQDMANRFTHLNATVHGMRDNVNDMTQPLRPFPGP